jgi:hypothetical protein
MPKLLEFSVDNVGLLIAVPAPYEDVSAVGVLDDAIKKVDASLEGAFRTVTHLGKAFQQSLRDMTGVKVAELEFGLQFTSKGSVYVVEAQGQASLKVKLTLDAPASTSAAVPGA